MGFEAKCNCQHCDGHIAFPDEMAGQMFECPHCKLETRLFIQPPKPDEKKPPASQQTSNLRACRDCGKHISTHADFCPHCGANYKTKHGVFFYVFWGVLSLAGTALIISVILAFFGIGIPEFLKGFNQASPISFKHETISTTNLHEATGALGWNLGDVLPSDAVASTNDETIGISFDVSITDLPGAYTGWICLTEDRRICEILISLDANKKDEIEAVKNTLKEKYGLREITSWAGVRDYYYGTTNREAELSIPENMSTVFLTYRDLKLYNLASKQKEQRKAAAQEATKKQIESNLKGHI